MTLLMGICMFSQRNHQRMIFYLAKTFKSVLYHICIEVPPYLHFKTTIHYQHYLKI